MTKRALLLIFLLQSLTSLSQQTAKSSDKLEEMRLQAAELFDNGKINECEKLSLQIKENYNFLENDTNYFKTIALLGLVYKNKGEYEKAKKCHEQVLTLAKKNNHNRSIRKSFYHLAISGYYLDDTSSLYSNLRNGYIAARKDKDVFLELDLLEIEIAARQRYVGIDSFVIQKQREVVSGFRKLKKEESLTTSLYRYGTFLANSGNTKDGLKALLEAIQIAEKVGNTFYQVEILNSLGVINGELNNLDKAIEYFHKAYRIADRNDLTSLTPTCLKFLATAFGHKGNTNEFKSSEIDSVLKYSLMAEKIALEKGQNANLYRLLSTRIKCALDYNNAVIKEKQISQKTIEGWLEKAKGNLSEKETINPDTYIFWRMLMQLRSSQKRYNEVLEISAKILHYAANNPNTMDRQTAHVAVYNTLSEMYYNKKEYKTSLEYLKFYVTARDSLITTEKNIALADATTKYETEKKEAENKLLMAENAKQAAVAKSATLKKRGWAAAAIGALLIALFSGLWFNQKRKATEQTLIMEKQKFSQQIEQQENKNLQDILDALEEERTRISQDLHDRIGAGISTAKLYFEGMKELVSKGDKQIEENFIRVDELLATSISEVRKVSKNITSGVLADFGLIPALLDLKETIESSGKLQFEFTNTIQNRLDKNIEINVYRSIQELVSNTIKYAECSAIQLSIAQKDAEVQIEYSDNGKGFNIKKQPQGLGHKNIDARINSLNGNYTLTSTVGTGVQYTFTIPL